MVSKKKISRMHEPFKVGLSGAKAPMTFDQAMDVILDPVNIKPPKKGKKSGTKK